MKGHYTVLYVEDYDDNYRLIEKMVERIKTKPIQLERASTAAMAQKFLAEQGEEFDLVFLDVQLPDSHEISFQELVSTARQHTRSGVLLVGLTAKAIKGDREMVLAAGCDDYVSKPVDIGELRRKLLETWLK